MRSLVVFEWSASDRIRVGQFRIRCAAMPLELRFPYDLSYLAITQRFWVGKPACLITY